MFHLGDIMVSPDTAVCISAHDSNAKLQSHFPSIVLINAGFQDVDMLVFTLFTDVNVFLLDPQTGGGAVCS